MFCDQCGAENRSDASFCRACGRDLSFEAAPTESHTPADRVPETVRQALAPGLRLERLLGRGGMGAVYLARDVDLDRPVAVKVLPAERSGDPIGVERFLREARIAARLRHPNIVSVHAVGERSGVYFFTMDYIDGDTLGGYLRRQGKPPPPAAARQALFRSICLAVAHAHGQGVVHRDLKPSNVMVDRSDHVLVMDFGLAKATREAGITSPEMWIGTPLYMSPEQLRGEPASTASDIYALGLILYHLYTGENLMKGEHVTAVVAAHLALDRDLAIGSDPRLPAGLRPLLLAMTARTPVERPASLAEVLRRLDQADVQEVPEAAPAPGAMPPAVSPSPSPYRKQARERLRGALERLPKKEDDA